MSWRGESQRHSLASRGIPTGRKTRTKKITPDVMDHPKDTKIFYNPFGPDAVPGYMNDIKQLLKQYKPQTTVMAYKERWWSQSDIIDSVYDVNFDTPPGYNTDKITKNKENEKIFLKMIESGQLEMSDSDFEQMLDQNHSKLLSDRFCEGEYYNDSDNETFEYDPMKGDCVYYAKALHDEMGYKGENYQVGTHNVLKYGDRYYDGNGQHTESELTERYGSKPVPDPDGWNYILDEDKLDYYRKSLRNKPLPDDSDLIGSPDFSQKDSKDAANMWRNRK